MIGGPVAPDARPAGWWIITSCGGAIVIFGIVASGRWASATAQRVAARLTPDPPRATADTFG